MCTRAAQAYASAVHAAPRTRILSSQPVDIVCRLAGHGLVLRLEAQASTQAWTEYDTTQVHLAQAYSGLPHGRSYLPQNVQGVGPQAFWSPGEGELVTTNGTESSAGSYLTVTVIRHTRSAPPALMAAAAVARAALPVAPRGPSPGPPPS